MTAGAPPPEAPEPEPLAANGDFDLILRPHRSLSPLGFWIIMAVLGAWSFVGGIVFLIVGAWPVIGFVGLDVALVWWAFRASYGDGRTRERLRHAGGILTVERMDKRGAVETHTLPATWLRAVLEPTSTGTKRLVLSSHGRQLVIGSFLPPDERTVLAAIINEGLARARRPAVQQP